MNTKPRLGKIAQLPKSIRDQLNQRLENGQQGPELLPWLNDLPETKELLAAKFDNQPITKSNLSHWRRGGYEDWLRHQARAERARRLSESGRDLEKQEIVGRSDLYDHFSRVLVAEMADDLESLGEAKDRKERRRILHNLAGDLVRLQNAYNRAQRDMLNWRKWNERFVTEWDYRQQLAAKEAAAKAAAQPPVAASRTESRKETETRYIHLAHCGCICRKCHPADGSYPYWDAERDHAAKKNPGHGYITEADGTTVNIFEHHCDCTCRLCDAELEAAGKARRSVIKFAHGPCGSDGLCRKCHAPDSDYPYEEAVRDLELARNRQNPIRGENGVSKCIIYGFCDCKSEDSAKQPSLSPSGTGVSPVCPDSHRQDARATTNASADPGRAALPRGPEIRQAPAPDETTHPSSTNPPLSGPLGPSRPLSPSSPPPHGPAADFQRRMDLLRRYNRLNAPPPDSTADPNSGNVSIHAA